MGGVAHFEIHVDDTARAKKFYGDVFGWTFSQFPGMEMEYWLIDLGDKSQGGAIMKRSAPAAPMGSSPSSFVCTMGVDSVNAAVDAAAKAGGQVAVPKMGIDGMGWVAYLLDTEGNILGVFEVDPTAKFVPPGEA
jgi:predicted enzyme related to lactoylglutathione lyase